MWEADAKIIAAESPKDKAVTEGRVEKIPVADSD